MISEFIVRKSIQNYQHTEDMLVRSRYVYLEGWASVLLNIFLFAINLLAGILSGSIALIVDSFHTLSDVLGSAVIMISSKIFAKPENKSHPFGHGRIEQVATIIIAVLLAVAGFEFFKSSLERLLNPLPVTAGWFALSVVILTILLKEWNARFAFYMGKKIKSDLLMASGHHHRSDAYSSLAVLVAIAGNFFHLSILDAIVGIVLSLFLFYVAYEIIKKGSDDILGVAPDPDDLEKITREALKVNGTLGVHDIIVHNYGNKKVVTCHVEVPLKLDLDAAHTISEKVEEQIYKGLGFYATVHIDPVDHDNPMVRKVSEAIAEILHKSQTKINNFHDVRIVVRKDFFNLVFDVTQKEKMNENEKLELNDFFKKEIQNYFPEIQKVSVQIEPLFSY